MIATAQAQFNMSVPDTSIIAAELWKPQEAGQSLELSGRLIVGSSSIADRIARNGSVGYLLAHAAWDKRAPLMHVSEQTASSDTDEPAECISAVPCFCGEKLHGVLVLCQHFGYEGRGAVEVWTRDDREELGLRESHFANLELIARITPFIKFPRAAGLPGQTWDNRCPMLMENLERNIDFMRATAAKSDGLCTGLAVPVMKTEHELTDVFVWLSSSTAPLARVYEIWKPDDGGTSLTFHSGAYGPYIELEYTNADLTIEAGTDLAGKVLETGRPELFEELPALASSRSELTQRYGLTQAISWPVYVGGKIGSVVNLLF